MKGCSSTWTTRALGWVAAMLVLPLVACGGGKSGAATPAAGPSFVGAAAGSAHDYPAGAGPTYLIRIDLASAPGTAASGLAAQVAGGPVTDTQPHPPIRFTITLSTAPFTSGAPVTFDGLFYPDEGLFWGGADVNGVSYYFDAYLSNGVVTGTLIVYWGGPAPPVVWPVAAGLLGQASARPYCGRYVAGGPASGEGAFDLIVYGDQVLAVAPFGVVQGTVDGSGNVTADVRSLSTRARLGALGGTVGAAIAQGTWDASGGGCTATSPDCGRWVATSDGCDFVKLAGKSFIGVTGISEPTGLMTFSIGPAHACPADSGTAGECSTVEGTYWRTASFDVKEVYAAHTGGVTGRLDSSHDGLSFGTRHFSTFTAMGTGITYLDAEILNGQFYGTSSRFETPKLSGGGMDVGSTGIFSVLPYDGPLPPQPYCGAFEDSAQRHVGSVMLLAGGSTAAASFWVDPASAYDPFPWGPTLPAGVQALGSVAGSALHLDLLDPLGLQDTGGFADGTIQGPTASGTWAYGAWSGRWSASTDGCQ